MSWDFVVGQRRQKMLLRNALLSGRLAHAYLFYGPEGVGKDAAAIEFGKAVNCEAGTGEACDRCSSCRPFNSLQHPNLKLVFAMPVGKSEKSDDSPVAKLSTEDLENVREQLRLKALNRYHRIAVPKATTIKVNSIRELKRESSLTAFTRGKKVMIIVDAENMNDEASNSLLKTLEEPTEDTLLILTTSARDHLLPTIISRCQPVRFDLLSEDEIAKELCLHHKVDEPHAQLISRLAHGSMSRAIELLKEDLQEQREKVVDFLRALHSGEVLQVSQFLDQLMRTFGSDRLQCERFLELLQFWLRDALCVSEGHTLVINVDQQESIERFVRAVAGANFPSLLTLVERSISLLNKNVYIPLILQGLSINLMKLLRAGSHVASSPEE